MMFLPLTVHRDPWLHLWCAAGNIKTGGHDRQARGHQGREVVIGEEAGAAVVAALDDVDRHLGHGDAGATGHRQPSGQAGRIVDRKRGLSPISLLCYFYSEI
jgi:hypothetical protein